MPAPATAARLVFRVVFVTVLLIVVGVIAVMGFGAVIEPMLAAFGGVEPPAGVDWGSPATTAVEAGAAAMIGVFVVIILWFIYAPIQSDVRQEAR